MAIIEITQYMLYMPINKKSGNIALKLANGSQISLKLSTIQFTAVTIILQNEKPVYFDSENKTIQTKAEPIGEAEM